MPKNLYSEHYGAWTSDKDKKDSVVRAVGTLMAANAGQLS